MELDLFLIGFISIVLYITLLFIAKKTGWKKKKVFENCINACPKCNHPLNRIPRKNIDYFIINITFRIFDFRRYKCSNSERDWEGLRW